LEELRGRKDRTGFGTEKGEIQVKGPRIWDNSINCRESQGRSEAKEAISGKQKLEKRKDERAGAKNSSITF